MTTLPKWNRRCKLQVGLIWNKLTNETICQFVLTSLKRLQACIRANGEYFERPLTANNVIFTVFIASYFLMSVFTVVVVYANIQCDQKSETQERFAITTPNLHRIINKILHTQSTIHLCLGHQISWICRRICEIIFFLQTAVTNPFSARIAGWRHSRSKYRT